jgi:hypothetical protein
MPSVGDLMHDPCGPDDRLERFVRDAYRGTTAAEPDATATARARLERALAAEPKPRRVRAGGASWFEPRLWFVRPAFAAAAVIVAIALGIVVGRGLGPKPQRGPSAIVPSPYAEARAARTVEFVLVAPEASNVSVVGDFNAWDPAATPLMRQGKGAVWSARVTLPAGRHVYSFVLDGERWMSDPQAPLEPANEFGFRNSVVVVSEMPPS